MDEARTSLFEVLVAVILGFGALGGAWAGYQASQWGSTSTEDYGKAATTATRASTLYNRGVAVATRDAQLDSEAKQAVLRAITAADDDVLGKQRDMTIAKYLYTMQMSDLGYAALGYPAAFRPKDLSEAEKDKASGMPDETLLTGLDHELDQAYQDKVLAEGTRTFAEADKIFAVGQELSGTSTQFGQDGMLFTVTLFLAGMALVLKTRLRWGFLAASSGSLAAALGYLIKLPWYG